MGYSAALIYIMNGLAKAVYIIGKISSTKQEILSSNCQISSVPIFNVSASNIGYKKGSILTVVH
jgi:ribosomal protein L30E